MKDITVDADKFDEVLRRPSQLQATSKEEISAKIKAQKELRRTPKQVKDKIEAAKADASTKWTTGPAGESIGILLQIQFPSSPFSALSGKSIWRYHGTKSGLYLMLIVIFATNVSPSKAMPLNLLQGIDAS